MTQPLISMLVALALASNLARAASPPEQVIREIPEEKVFSQPPGQQGTGQQGTGQKVTGLLLELDSPGITSIYYELRGHVQYDNVEGVGYLEMWSDFGGGERYFSRSMSASGPQQSLSGTSSARPFVLPFRSNRGRYPQKLTLNVVLPGAGTVKVSGMKLVQLPAPPQFASWWNERTAGWVGGIMGAGIGILGGLIGLLNSWQKSRRAAMVMTKVATAISIAMLIGGIGALVMRQPYHVWYPMMLCGVIGTLVLGGGIFIIRRQMAELELRKMSAMDAPR